MDLMNKPGISDKGKNAVFITRFFRKKTVEIFLAVILMVITVLLFLPVNNALTLEIVNPSRNDIFQVFYDIGDGFNEIDSKFVAISLFAREARDPAICRVTVPLPAQKIKSIRLDLGRGPGEWNLKNIILEARWAGFVLRSHIWLPEDIVRDFAPLHAIDTFSAKDKEFFLNASGNDPYFGYKTDFGKVQRLLRESVRFFKVILWGFVAFFWFSLIFLNRKTIFEILTKLFYSTKRWFLPFPDSPWIFPVWFWVFLAILTGIKLWLVSAQTITAISSAGHDDGLFMGLAQHIASGEWFGPYNNVTLLKEPFYSFWIAAMFWLGIPLGSSHALLYVFSCLIFIIAVRPLLRNSPFLCAMAYMTLLFHPISYPVIEMQRAYRDGIYFSLPLLVLSFATGLLLRKDAPIKRMLLWSIGLGFSSAAFLLTREENVILMPSLILLLATLGGSILWSSQEKKKRLKVCCVSIGIAVLLVGAVAGINRIYYGAFTTCELTQSDYVHAYGALLRVKPKLFQRSVLVPQEARERIYAVSPAFDELRPFLEGDLKKTWGRFGPYRGRDFSTRFIFAFRDAVALAGYYSSGDNAAKYYRRLTSEINNACDQRILECYKGRHDSMIPVWRNEYFKPLVSVFWEVAFAIMRLEKIHVDFRPRSFGSDNGIIFFKDMTRDRIALREGDPPLFILQQRVDELKLHALNSLLSFFRCYAFILALFGIVSYIYHMVLGLIKHKLEISFIITTAFLVAVLARIFFLSMIEATTAPGIHRPLMYQSSAYPILAAFSLIAIGMFFGKNNNKHFPGAAVSGSEK